MAERRLEIAPFGGLVTSVDESVIGQTSASDLLNVRIGDGRLRTRLGHTSISALLSGAVVMGSEFVRGYDDSYAYKEEVLQFLDVSGTRKPHGVNLTTGTRTEILNGASPVALAAGDWTALSFNGEALAFKRGGAVYRHAIGDATSWKPLDVSSPATLTTGLNLSFETTEDVSDTTPAGTVDFTTSVTGDFTDLTANTTFDSIVGTGFKLNKTASGVCGWKVLLPGNPLDWEPVTTLNFTIACPAAHLVSSGHMPVVTVKVNDAVTDSVVLEVTSMFSMASGIITVSAKFPTGTDMSLFDDVATLEFTLDHRVVHPVTGVAVNIFDFTVSEIDLVVVGTGGGLPTISGTPERMRFGIAPFDSETGQESADVLASAWLKLDSGPTRYFDDAGTSFLGNVPTAGLPAPITPANSIRVYVQFELENIWRLVTTTEELSHEIELTSAKMKLLPERVVLVRVPVGDVECAAAHSGFVAWGVAGGKGNLKLSAFGDPGRLANDLDYLLDQTRGANWTLSDDFTDEPVGMASSDVSLYIGGRKGLYVMTGTSASSMTPPKRVPGSAGLIGARAITKWRDDSGNPGVAYIDVTGRLWLVQVLSTNSEFGLRLSPIDIRIQGHIDSWLLGSSPTHEAISLVGDFETDSLWLCYGTKTLVLRRASVATGQREWEAYSYASTWARVIEDDKSSPIAVKSDSSVHRLDLGTTDAGGAIPTPYWESKEFSDVNRSLHRVEVEREPMSSIPSVTITSDRGTTTKACTANARHVKFHVVTQQGWKHKVKVALDAVTTVINRLVITERVPAGKGLDR